jgi:hypothetical protein
LLWDFIFNCDVSVTWKQKGIKKDLRKNLSP